MDGYRNKQVADFEDMIAGIEKILEEVPEKEADLKELQTVLIKISNGMGIEISETN
jgi:hypothetical protein